MPLTISDETLHDLRMSEREALIELACRLFDAEKLNKPAACRLAGLTRIELEDELTTRGLPIIHYTDQMWQEDLEALAKMDAASKQERTHPK